MNLSLDEVDHLLKALHTMSSHDVARAREMIAPGTTNHNQLVQKLKDYRLRLTWAHYSSYHSWYYLLSLWRWHGVSNDLSKWSHGGLEQSSINILRLISELEGAYQLTKYMAYDDDNLILTEMKQRYYKLYYQTVKREKLQTNMW